MVVTRRPPAPVPTSRTNSSQPIPRPKSKTQHDSTQPSAPSPLSNGVTHQTVDQNANDQSKPVVESDSPSKKEKHKNKTKQKKADKKAKKKGSGLVDLLTRIFLLGFTIYTLSVCPTDEKLQSPLCRGLQYYRQLVLDPFVLPPIKLALSHPSIAPYVERATPYANQFVNTAKPIAVRARTEWNARIVPQWNKRVVPLWNAHVVPQWDKYGAPQVTRIEKQLEPYRLKAVHEYERRLGPHLRLAVYNLQKWQRQAQPYIILAANKTYDGYQKSKPYTIPVLQRLKGLFARLARFLAAQRRQYVDPHVKIIWDRVIELSSGKSRPETGTSPTATHAASFVSSSSSIGQASPHSITPVVVSESDSFQESTFATSPTSTASGKSQRGEQNDEAEDITPLLAKDTAPAGTIAASPTPSAIPSVSQASDHASSFVPGEDHVEHSEPVNSGSDIALDSSAPTAIPHSAQSSTSIKDTVLEESGGYSSLTSDGQGSAPSTPSGADRNVVLESTPTSVPQKIDTPPSEDGDVDLDQFWAELGLGDDMLNDSSETLDAEISEPTESEEEKAERIRLRLEETARKRADITARHSQWEAQLEERFEENLKLLRRALVTIRKGAVVELKDSAEIRKEVETLVEEAEKYLKGAEKYLGNLRRESRTVDDKRAMWDRVVERVDSKFGERLSQTEALVNGWFNQVLNKEIEEVRKLSEQVKDIADRGQADMGLDYAWLDDVTYNDWQRYHALVHRSDAFTAEAFSIQNGSHPSPPTNPVLPALEDLQSEVQDVVVGFETRLRGIKRKGERALDAGQSDDSTIETKDETNQNTNERENGDRESVADIPHVVIGRSKKEVMEALNRVADQEGSATSNPRSSSNKPEQVMEELVHQVEEQVSSSPKMLHEEL